MLIARSISGKLRFGAGSLGRALGAGLLALSLGVVEPSRAEAASPFLVVPEPGVAELTPAYRYANMTDEEAFAELDKRQILYTRLGAVHGVRAPIRLTGRLRGVYFHSALPPEQRVTSIFEILDARLALALDDFAAVLAHHDIDEVVHYTMYRPNVARPGHDDHGDEDQSKSARAEPSARKRSAEKPKAAAAPTEDPPAAPKSKSSPSARTNTTGIPAPAATANTKKSLAGKASLDSKKGREAPSTSKKQKSSTGLAPKSAAAPILVAAPKSSAAPQSSAAPTAPKASTSRRSGPVASTKNAGQSPRPRTSWAPPGTRHPAGLAIDVGMLRKRDGRWLSVASHFHGKIGDKTCGAGVSLPQDPDAKELRSIVCEASDLGIFTYVLTPNYNAAHADHYHMEIKPGVRWFLYH